MSEPARHPLADTAAAQAPVTYIRPPRGWVPVDFGELWRYRELFGFLVWRDIMVRYKQTLLGAFWAIVVPFTQMGIFGIIFGKAARLPSNGLDYNIYILLALVPWNFFGQAMNRSAQSLVGNANLLTKIYFPRVIVPISAAVAGLIDFAIAFAGLLILMLALGVVPALTTLLIPILLVIALATALGVGMVLAALNVKYRDIGFLIPFLTQMWMWCSVLMPFSSIEPRLGRWAYLYGLNPMGGVVEGFRWCMAHQAMKVERLVQGQMVSVPVGPPWVLIAIGAAVSAVLFTCGLFYFRRVEKQFADIV